MKTYHSKLIPSDSSKLVPPSAFSVPPSISEPPKTLLVVDDEQRNAIERAVIMARGNKINLEDHPTELRGQTVGGARGNGASLEVGSLVSMEKLEEAHLRKVVERTSSLAEAAEVLGIDQATLYRKRKKMGLE